MAWVGSTFVRNNSAFTGPTVWTEDRDAGTKITAAHHDYHDQDIADGITLCLRNDGGNSVTGNIPYGGFKNTNMAGGSSATDSATYGQTITALALNPATNILTATRATGGNITVDLSALAVGGSTADFARYSNGSNPFQGSATFEGTLGCQNAITILDPLTVSGATYTWVIDPPTSTSLNIENVSGAVLNFSGNSSVATLKVNGDVVWTQGALTQAQIDAFLLESDNATITGSWTFQGQCSFVASIMGVSRNLVASNGSETATISFPTTTTWQVSLSTGPAMRLGPETTYGSALRIGGTDFAWHTGSLRTTNTVAPTGGNDNDLSFVPTGADRGIWMKLAGVWTKLIAFP